MYKKKIKRIIAREGLIIIGLAVVSYIAVSLFFKNIPIELPRYRLEFANGEAHTITINPEIRNDSNYKKLLDEAYNPTPKFVEQRIKEFVKSENIRSPLINQSLINSNQTHISKLYSYVLGLTFIFKLAIVYLVLLLLRFIIWAIKTLRDK